MRRIFVVMIVLFSSTFAAQLSESAALDCVKGWLNARKTVLGTPLEAQAVDVVSCHDGSFYAVNLLPEGYVIVSADDSREPVIAFSFSGSYNSSPESPVNALLGKTAVLYAQSAATDEQAAANLDKRSRLESYKDGYIKPMLAVLDNVSDVCVAPLTQSLWNQLEVCSAPAYNRYTPGNYPAGCVATAMAQLMRFHEYPDFGIGQPSFAIGIDGSMTTAKARGGDGAGGPYNWSLMDLVPDCSSTPESLAQIGALCYDAGISIGMAYSAAVSTAETFHAGAALRNTFGYADANYLYKADYESAYVAVTSNLNAGLPVLLGLSTADYVEPYLGHSVVCDGYGYDLGTVYHHVNMGWSGYDNLWYSFPQMEILSVVDDVVYNVSPDTTGGIISGRVTMLGGGPVEGALITAGELFAYSNANGIYAITGVAEGTHYPTAHFAGFDDSYVRAEISTNGLNWRNTCESNFILGRAPFTVTFLAGEHGSITSGQAVQLNYDGNPPKAPVITPDAGWNFIGWDVHFAEITADTTITAMYSDAPYAGDGFEACAIGSLYTLSGISDWFLTYKQFYSGGYSIQSGFIADDEESAIEVTVSGAAKISFRHKISSEDIYDCLRFYIDGEQAGVWSGINDWSLVSFVLPSTGSHVLKWAYTKDESLGYGDDCVWIDDIELLTDYQSYTATFLPGEHGSITSGNAVQSIVEGMDAYPPTVTSDEGWTFVGWDTEYIELLSDITVTAQYSDQPYQGDDFGLRAISDFYTCSGDVPWKISYEGHDSAHSMRSGVIDDDQSSVVELTVEGVAGVSFWKRIETEEFYDFFSFYIDGVLVERWDGIDADWTLEEYPLTVSGSHTLKWEYVKDGSFAAGEDCVKIDDISFVTAYETCTVTFMQGEHGTISGETVQTVVVGHLPVMPVVTPDEGWNFVGWDTDYFNITADTVITATYCDLDYHSDRFERRAITSFYTNSGDRPWELANTGYLSSYSIRSGDIADSQTSTIEVTVSGASSVSFMRYVSTEQYYDFLRFFVDDVEMGNWSGVVEEWRETSFALDPLTTHVLKWTYEKDVSTSEGLDCVFVDDIILTKVDSYHPDINDDGFVNQADLAFICEYWLFSTADIPEGLHAIDLDLSSSVDMRDFAVMARHWLE